MAIDSATLSPAIPEDVIADAVSVLKVAKDAGMRIATAESCTGGLLGSLLTDIEGASDAFERGFIAYSKRAKCDLLGLDRTMIETCCAVSKPVSRAMAEGALARSDADVAVATTGFAGPAGPEDEPGLVHFACAAHRMETRHRVEHFGDIGRGATRIASLRVALDMLRDMLAAVATHRSRAA